MAPSTVTTVGLLLLGLGLLALLAYVWSGPSDPRMRTGARTADQDPIEVAVLEMRRSIEDYERRQRP